MMERSSPEGLRPGDVIAQYTVESLLGQGGMAVVYKVRHNTLESHHAMKLLTVQGRTISQRLVQEGRVQARLRHPNIVAVTDYVEHDGRPGLVMEYVDGPSLQEWLARNQRPEPELAEQWFRAIVGAVQHAHAQGLVHRDLKPGNVLLQPVGNGFVPKVADFGIAKVLVDDGVASAVSTRTGMPMGSPPYMAPEQIRSAKDVDRRADVFSLGCILYELATGVRAFPGDDIVELFGAVTSGLFTDPGALRPQLEPRVRQVIRACLRADRDLRVQDCAGILAMLDGDPTVVDPTPAPVPRDAFGPALGPGLPIRPDTSTFAPDLLDRSEPATDPGVRPAVSDRRRAGIGVAVLGVGGVIALVAVGLLALVGVWWSGVLTPEAPVDPPLIAAPAPTVAPAPVAVEPAPEPVPEPAPVAIAPTPEPAVAPPPRPRPPPAPTAPPLSGTWSGSSGSGPMTLEITRQSGRDLSGSAQVPGGRMAVSGTVDAAGTSVRLAEVGGAATFSATLDTSGAKPRLAGTWRRDEDGQPYQWLVVHQ
ncbi:MAG: serine/threonine protein kinase [Alphaproteobacteria bacterium]|nr:serine/threonine protein kinase [Alphaproteobacteria bacterium]MCB9699326.1 serine/threonine protein kinase [Alphaproteobacteria bacterium]